MRTAFVISLICFCVRCAPGPGSDKRDGEVASDSATTHANGTLSDSTSGDVETDAPDSDTLSLAIESALDDLANQSAERCPYTLSAQVSGYESGSDATYHYDSAVSLRYVVVQWDMEGSSGSYTYYFNNDQLIAGREENSYNDYEEIVAFHSRFRPVSGYSLTNGTEDDSQPGYLSEGDFILKQVDAINEYQRLLARISELRDSVAQKGDEFVFRTEKVVNYGEDFTEKEEYRMSRAVYEKLFKE